MKAIILAGGQNKRLSGEIDIPKSLLKFEGEPILLRQIRFLKNAGLKIEDIFVITGHKHEMIEEVHRNTLFNEKFKETDNGYAVYFGLKRILELNLNKEEEIIIFDGDLVYDGELIKEIFASNKKNLLVTKEMPYEEGKIKDETLVVNESSEVLKMIIPPKGTFLTSEYKDTKLFVYSGIIKLSIEKARELFISLTPEFWNTWYTLPLPRIINQGGFYNLPLPKSLKFCFDVDKKEDLVFLRNQVETINRMFVAGPVNVSPNVKNATVYSEIGHRENEFTLLFKEIKEKLLYAFGVPNKSEKFGTVVIGGSGTSATETLLSSILHKEKKNLVVANGAFGERIAEICAVYKIPTVVLNYGWGGYPNLEEIEKKLIEEKDIEAVSMVYMETSTGALNPITQVGKLCKQYNKIFIVDAISSLGGEKLDMEKDNIDYCLTNTNKCLGGLPVLGIICYKHSTLERSLDILPRSYSLDFFKHIKYSKQNQTPFTPIIPLFYMLNQALTELVQEGIENRIERYKKNGELLKNKLKEMGLQFHLKTEYMSNLMVNVIIPSGLDYEIIHDEMKEKKYIFYPGKGPLDGKVIHIANIGTLKEEDVLEFCKDLKEVLIKAHSLIIKRSSEALELLR